MGIPLFVNRFIDIFLRKKFCKKFGSISAYYLASGAIPKKAIVYSAGVGKDISFELDLLNKFNARIFIFDPSPTGRKTMESIEKKHIYFYPKGIAEKTGKVFFSKPANLKEGSYTLSNINKGEAFDCISISDFFKKMNHKKVDLLKIDIEGFEYGVIEDILRNELPITQIVLEFHHFLTGGSYLKTLVYLRKLNRAGYSLISKDVDNYTFIRKDSL